MSFIVSSGGGASAVTRIYTTTLASDTASINITAIPQTYTNLELIIYASATSYVRSVALWCLPFSGANQPQYLANGYMQQMFSTGTSNAGGSTLNFTSDYTAGIMPGGQSNPAPAQYLFGTTKIFLANYSSATSSKGWMSVSHQSGTYNVSTSVNASTFHHGAAHFSVTNSTQLGAIDRLYVYPASGNFREGSVFTLYGWS